MLNFARRNSVAFLLAWCAALAAVYLWPFRFADVEPAVVANDATFDGPRPGVTFPQNGMLISAPPTAALHGALVGGVGMSVEVLATPAALDQTGPARIVSYSDGNGSRNFTLGQDGPDLIFRVRIGRDDPNGVLQELRVPDVFQEDLPRQLVITYDLATIGVFVDGVARAQVPRPSGDLGTWDPDHRLVVGNEVSGNRPWRGTVAWIALHGRPLTPQEVARGARRGGPSAAAPAAVYDFRRGLPPEGPLHRPLIFDSESGPPLLGLGARRPADIALGFSAFAVLSALAAWSLTRDRGTDARTVVAAALVACAGAVAAEALQVFVTGRTSSLVDLAAALAGAATGALLASRPALAGRG